MSHNSIKTQWKYQNRKEVHHKIELTASQPNQQ